MTVEEAAYLGQQAMMTALIVSSPVLIVCLVVGTIMSIVQTVTQVQEQSVVFVPKMGAVLVVLALAGGFMIEQMVQFGETMFVSVGDRP